jgi:hypothetical protein
MQQPPCTKNFFKNLMCRWQGRTVGAVGAVGAIVTVGAVVTAARSERFDRTAYKTRHHLRVGAGVWRF